MAGAARLSTGGITFFVPAGIAGPSIGVYDFCSSGERRDFNRRGSTVVPVGIPKPSTGGVTTVDPVGRAFLTNPPEGKKELTGTVLDAVSRMLATYADLKGDATYAKWKSFHEKFTDD